MDRQREIVQGCTAVTLHFPVPNHYRIFSLSLHHHAYYVNIQPLFFGRTVGNHRPLLRRNFSKDGQVPCEWFDPF